MSTKTEGLYVGDVVRWEVNRDYCREKLTVADGETITVGTVCYQSGGKAYACSTAVNEVQTLAIGGTISGGSFKLGITNPTTGSVAWTDTIAHNATFSTVITNINTALDDLLGASKVVASGSAYTAITLTFSGTGYSGKSHELVQVDTSSLTGASTATVTRTTAGHAVGEDADCIALEAAAPDGEDGEAVFLVRGPAIVAADNLTWPTGGATLGEPQLKTLGIIPVHGPETYS